MFLAISVLMVCACSQEPDKNAATTAGATQAVATDASIGANTTLSAAAMQTTAANPTSVAQWADVLEQNPDAKVVTDADLLKRIAATGLPWRVKHKSTGMEMLLVPPGIFVMGMSPGDEAAEPVEKPAHEVTLSNAFYLGRTEVTQAQWKGAMQNNPSVHKWTDEGLTEQESDAKNATDSLPVDNVTWNECQTFCVKTGLSFPTAAQWEYACRAGVRKPTYGAIDDVAWYEKNSQNKSHPVAKKAANALGFYDMLGNQYEWCADYFAANYFEQCKLGVVDPVGPAQSKSGDRVSRGGSWDSDEAQNRASFRTTGSPVIQYPNNGFRAARNP
jgi:formylglycine-generating enzyme required for sulfatase activity